MARPAIAAPPVPLARQSTDDQGIVGERIGSLGQFLQFFGVFVGGGGEALRDQELLGGLERPPGAFEVEDRLVAVRERHPTSLPGGHFSIKHPPCRRIRCASRGASRGKRSSPPSVPPG